MTTKTKRFLLFDSASNEDLAEENFLVVALSVAQRRSKSRCSSVVVFLEQGDVRSVVAQFVNGSRVD